VTRFVLLLFLAVHPAPVQNSGTPPVPVIQVQPSTVKADVHADTGLTVRWLKVLGIISAAGSVATAVSLGFLWVQNRTTAHANRGWMTIGIDRDPSVLQRDEVQFKLANVGNTPLRVRSVQVTARYNVRPYERPLPPGALVDWGNVFIVPNDSMLLTWKVDNSCESAQPQAWEWLGKGHLILEVAGTVKYRTATHWRVRVAKFSIKRRYALAASEKGEAHDQRNPASENTST
jgi:hypothetical protein